MTESTIKVLTERLASTRGAVQASQGAERVPLSLTQQALLRQHRSGLAIRNLHAAWVVSPAPDPDRLERAARELLRRHEILRTIYPADRRVPYQRVLDLPASLIDHADGLDDEALRGTLDEHASAPIDVSRELPVRLALFGAGDRAVLAVTVHQIAADDMALAQVAQELGRFYRAPDERTPSAQYRDFSAAHLGAAGATAASDPDLGYWAEHLTGAPGRIIPVPATPTRTGSHVTVRAQVDAWAVEQLLGPRPADRQDAALMALIAGAVHNEWGAADIAIGVLDTLRPDGAETVVGHFANRLVCRVRIDPHQSPADLVGAIESGALDALAHRGARIERVAALAAPRDGAQHPAPFQVSYAGFRSLPPRPVLDGHQVQTRDYRAAVPPQADLSFAAWPHAAGWSIEMTATPELAAAHDVAGFAGRLSALAPVWAGEPRRALGDQQLPGAGTDELLEQFSRGPALPAEAGAAVADQLAALVGAPAGSAPGATAALRMAGRRWARAELAARVAETVDRLRGAGVGPSSVVATEARAPEAAVVTMGTLRLGAAVALLASDAARARALLGDLAPTVVLADAGAAAGLRAVAAELGVATVDLAADAGRGSPVANTAPEQDGSRPDAPALLVPSATGAGWAVHSRRELSACLAHYRAASRPDMPLTIVAGSLAAGGVAARVVAALIAGQTVTLVDPDDLAAPEVADAVITDGGVLVATPTVLAVLAERAAGCGLRLAARQVIVTGEALSGGRARAVRRVTELVPVLVAHEPDTCGPVAQGPFTPTAGGTGMVAGRPTPGSVIRVVDGYGRPVPPGVVGDLHVATALGPGDEPSPRPTGDRATWTADGVLVLRGRADREVTARGHRVALGEVEDEIAEVPGVLLAAAVAREAATGDPSIDGYVALATGADPVTVVPAVYQHLRSRLPAHAVPASVTVLEQVPLTDAGALDRSRLPAPAETRLAGCGGPPQGPTEQVVADAMRAVLDLDGVTEIGREDSFFALGGDSLAALRLVSRLQGSGCQLEVQTVFLHPVLHELAYQVDHPGDAGAAGPREPERPVAPMSASGLDASALEALRARLGAVTRQPG